MKRNNATFVMAALLCLIFLIGICHVLKLNEPIKKTNFCLDTICTIEIDNMDKKQGEILINQAFDRCEELEGLLSKTRKESEIYKINHSHGKTIRVSKDTMAVLKCALKVSEETGGLFDLTMGRLTNLWDFTGENIIIPKQEKIDKALETVGYKQVKIRGNTVRITNPDTWIDLGGIAKGYIARELALFLQKKGVDSGLINLGGDMIAIGGQGIFNGKWPIGIERPFTQRQEIIGKVSIKNETLLTSGTYERCFEEKGKSYHHILNPKTGYPAATDILSFTVKSTIENGPYCDGYATAGILLGSQQAKDFLDDKPEYQFAMIKNNMEIYQSKDFNMKEERGK